MLKRIRAAVMLSCVAIVSPTFADAGQHPRHLQEYQLSNKPRGLRELCDRRPEFCVHERTRSEVTQIIDQLRRAGAAPTAVQRLELTPARWRQLEAVNLEVNRTVTPTRDVNRDYWSFSASAGDCEEYVLLKRETLASLGWPRASMRIAVVRGIHSPYHAVLVVTTDNDEFILDNLNDRVVSVHDSPYEFVVGESVNIPGAWVRIRKNG